MILTWSCLDLILIWPQPPEGLDFILANPGLDNLKICQIMSDMNTNISALHVNIHKFSRCFDKAFPWTEQLKDFLIFYISQR